MLCLRVKLGVICRVVCVCLIKTSACVRSRRTGARRIGISRRVLWWVVCVIGWKVCVLILCG